MTTTRAPIAYAMPSEGATYCPACAAAALITEAADSPHPAAAAIMAVDFAAIYDHDETPDAGLTCDRCLTEIVEGVRLVVRPDDCPESPREDGDTFSTFYVPAGNRYVAGDKGAADPRDMDPAEILASLPVYAYVHSGVALSCGAFSCPWDSGQVGVIYVTRDRAAEWYGGAEKIPARLEEIETMLRGEIETLTQWYAGDVWEWTLYKAGEAVDGCGGYYGDMDAADLPTEAAALFPAAWDARFDHGGC